MVTQTSTSRERQQQSINRAYDRAHDQARAGNRPTLTEATFDGTAIRETWNVESRSQPGRRYAVSLSHDVTSIRTVCTCPATGVCYHRALVRLAHQDAITSRNEAGIRIRPRRTA